MVFRPARSAPEVATVVCIVVIVGLVIVKWKGWL